jgi:hypothetical protein
MNERTSAPFESIESSHEYVALLLQAIEETAADVRKDLGRPNRAAAVRRRQGFQLVAYKLDQLRRHVATSHCLLNDLRTLRRMLQAEGAMTPATS